jgi:protease I
MNIKNQKLKNKKIAVLMADGFEMAEYTVPVNALRMAGASITVVSLRRGRIRGVNLHEPSHRVHVDQTIEKASAANFDALFVPGGFINPDLLRQSQLARTFVTSFEQAQKPIATLCHGPWVLASSGIVNDRALTAWPGIRDDVVNAGGIWLDQPVVRDGNLLTSRGPQDFAQFVPALVEFFAESAVEMAARTFSPEATRTSSPRRTQPPSIVLGTMRWMPRPSLRGFALGALAAGLLLSMRNSRSGSSRTIRPQRRPQQRNDREALVNNAFH